MAQDSKAAGATGGSSPERISHSIYGYQIQRNMAMTQNPGPLGTTKIVGVFIFPTISTIGFPPL